MLARVRKYKWEALVMLSVTRRDPYPPHVF